ncbi:MAG: hypothetical protein M3273_04585 [Actinomycetota bacterium]|nr:hypothetical protein [Actinomycetota bacterium]
MNFDRRVAVAGLAAAALLSSALAAPFASATAPRRGPAWIDDAEDCLEGVPAAASVTDVTDDGQRISLDALVLLDGVPVERGREVMKKAEEAYAPLRISLDVRYEEVAFAPEEPGDGTAPPASPSLRLLEDAKRWTFGARPADTDVVYVLTHKDISDAAGRADCIGGVRYPEFAFAVGEDFRHENLAGIFYKFGTAKIAGHEIGHLMGAHHHYANCAEGTPGAVNEQGPTPCSLMFNFIDFMSLIFNNLEGSVVRGHAIEFASRGPDADRVGSSAVELRVESGIARGTIASQEPSCRDRSEVRLQRYTSERPYEEQEWVDVAAGMARRGAFRINASGISGELRAFVPEQTFEDAEGEILCAQAASRPVEVT